MSDEFEQKMGRLRENLQTALMVELSTIPPYLCALYSIREGTNREAAAVLHSVVMEEMLHMALVANMLNAVGGTPRVGHRDSVPTYPTQLLGQDFEIELEPFSEHAIATFMRIESPAPDDAGDIGEGMTIGQFYAGLRQELKDLCHEYPGRVFVGDPSLQITTEYYYGGAGSVFPVECLATANDAIDEIVDQGEGAHGKVFEPDYEVRSADRRPVHLLAPADAAVAGAPAGVAGSTPGAFRHKTFSGEEEPPHFYRFMEIREGRYFQEGDTRETGPHGPEFPVQWSAVHPMHPNPKSVEYPEGSEIRRLLDAFNLGYMKLLDRLERGFQGNPSVLRHMAGDMYALKQRAMELMRVPRDDGETTVGPSFEYVERVR